MNNQNQGQDFLSDHNKFEFQDGLLYHDGLVYVPNGLAWVQVLQAKHDAPIKIHHVFYVYLLEPYYVSIIPKEFHEPPPPHVKVDGEQQYEVEGVFHSRVSN